MVYFHWGGGGVKKMHTCGGRHRVEPQLSINLYLIMNKFCKRINFCIFNSSPKLAHKNAPHVKGWTKVISCKNKIYCVELIEINLKGRRR